uniref:5'-Nucleotidase C-terminal domain-containing protein n=1 Tax=Chromera velia CCMP2878 TaxID=1169474 RepID=A0A0G4GL64_9ALVE|eukprot:Cvel_22406.t1-p1 / transcript=Cvel_22406.t1 / gene=Cvel_22406 / organism=Chromera_velia_CCMP2878 / gene_product=hypothetical protein / transcript_product=hypothetical protein / location=Cvel_scaffold2198:16897-20972(+) / protein_length=853 / sequence_SO=supercontig / SO=protein_coding / is_pseudo=false
MGVFCAGLMLVVAFRQLQKVFTPPSDDSSVALVLQEGDATLSTGMEQEDRVVAVRLCHFSDFHAAYTPSSTAAGIGMMKAALDHFCPRRSPDASLRLFGGDWVAGPDFPFAGGMPVRDLISEEAGLLDGWTLGNHEFDQDSFFANTSRVVPAVVSNLQGRWTEPPPSPPFVKPFALHPLPPPPAEPPSSTSSAQIETEGKEAVCLLGLLTPSTVHTARPNKKTTTVSKNLHADLEAAARVCLEEAQRQGRQNVAFILMSHLGFEEDVAFVKASKVPLAAVVGAHTHTVHDPDTDTDPPGDGGGSQQDPDSGTVPKIPYPFEVRGALGQTVWIVHAGASGSFLGVVDLDLWGPAGALGDSLRAWSGGRGTPLVVGGSQREKEMKSKKPGGLWRLERPSSLPFPELLPGSDTDPLVTVEKKCEILQTGSDTDGSQRKRVTEAEETAKRMEDSGAPRWPVWSPSLSKSFCRSLLGFEEHFLRKWAKKDSERRAEAEAHTEAKADKVLAVSSKGVDGEHPACRVGSCEIGILVCDALRAFVTDVISPPPPASTVSKRAEGVSERPGWLPLDLEEREGLLERLRTVVELHGGMIVSLQPGGNLRSSVGRGEVTEGSVRAVLPWRDGLRLLSVTPRALCEALERGAARRYDSPGGVSVSSNGKRLEGVSQAPGGFPQFAGMRVTLAVEREGGEGSRSGVTARLHSVFVSVVEEKSGNSREGPEEEDGGDTHVPIECGSADRGESTELRPHGDQTEGLRILVVTCDWIASGGDGLFAVSEDTLLRLDPNTTTWGPELFRDHRDMIVDLTGAIPTLSRHSVNDAVHEFLLFRFSSADSQYDGFVDDRLRFWQTETSSTSSA